MRHAPASRTGLAAELVLLIVALTATLPRAATAQGVSLVGVWRSQSAAAFSALILQNNGRYGWTSQTGQYRIVSWGSWALHGSYLRLRTAGHSPRQWCGPLGCNPIRYPETHGLQIQMLNAYAFRAGNEVYRRAQ